jgi:hypothetical protein
MSVGRPATAGCPQEELIGGDGVQTGVRRLHPGGSRRPAGGEVLEVPTGRSRVGCAGRRAVPARQPAAATDQVDGRVWGRVGQRVSVVAPVRRRWRAGRG